MFQDWIGTLWNTCSLLKNRICSLFQIKNEHQVWWIHSGAFWLLPVLFNAGQQGLQPAHRTLAVSVQEGDDLTFGGGRAPQPGSDQTRTLLHPQDPYGHLQSAHVVLQLLLQEVWNKTARVHRVETHGQINMWVRVRVRLCNNCWTDYTAVDPNQDFFVTFFNMGVFKFLAVSQRIVSMLMTNIQTYSGGWCFFTCCDVANRTGNMV